MGDDSWRTRYVWVRYGKRRIGSDGCSRWSEETKKEDTRLLQRKISNQELAWTMGEDYREQAVYEEKLHAVEDHLHMLI